MTARITFCALSLLLASQASLGAQDTDPIAAQEAGPARARRSLLIMVTPTVIPDAAPIVLGPGGIRLDVRPTVNDGSGAEVQVNEGVLVVDLLSMIAAALDAASGRHFYFDPTQQLVIVR